MQTKKTKKTKQNKYYTQEQCKVYANTYVRMLTTCEQKHKAKQTKHTRVIQSNAKVQNTSGTSPPAVSMRLPSSRNDTARAEPFILTCPTLCLVWLDTSRTSPSSPVVPRGMAVACEDHASIRTRVGN